MLSVLPPWSDSLLRLLLILVLAFVVGVPVLAMTWVRTPMHQGVGEPIVQPVQFDHRHHVRDDGMDCFYCHYDAARSPYAGVPTTELCMGCHGQIWNESPELAAVRASWMEGVPLRWRRVYDLPDFAFFDHAAHVQHNVGCETCHGRVDRMAIVYRAVPSTMAFCLDCHRDPDPHLRPDEDITRMGVPPDRARGAILRRERAIDPPTHCSGCHR